MTEQTVWRSLSKHRVKNCDIFLGEINCAEILHKKNAILKCKIIFIVRVLFLLYPHTLFTGKCHLFSRIKMLQCQEEVIYFLSRNQRKGTIF